METTEKKPMDLGTFAWGAIFILWGITGLFKDLPEGLGALGLGIILIGLNIARRSQGQPASGFSTTLGILALLLGALQFAQPYLHLAFELPIFPILLLALGAILLGGAWKEYREHA